MWIVTATVNKKDILGISDVEQRKNQPIVLAFIEIILLGNSQSVENQNYQCHSKCYVY